MEMELDSQVIRGSIRYVETQLKPAFDLMEGFSTTSLQKHFLGEFPRYFSAVEFKLAEINRHHLGTDVARNASECIIELLDNLLESSRPYFDQRTFNHHRTDIFNLRESYVSEQVEVNAAVA